MQVDDGRLQFSGCMQIRGCMCLRGCRAGHKFGDGDGEYIGAAVKGGAGTVLSRGAQGGAVLKGWSSAQALT